MRSKNAIRLLLTSMLSIFAVHTIAAGPEMGSLRGPWYAGEVVYDQEKLAGKDLQDFQMTFATKRVVLSMGGTKQLFNYEADAQGHINFVEDKDKGLKLPGIYKVEGEKLKISLALATKIKDQKLDRPTSFEPAKGVLYAVLVRNKK